MPLGSDAIEVLAIALFAGYRTEIPIAQVDWENELDYWLHLSSPQREVWLAKARAFRRGLEQYASKHR